MIPDFSKSTIDIIAKRAGFICSNPDCRVKTVGPNTDPEKSISIGEAAHIYGAKPMSKRYRADMTEITRAEITNAIWLCRNCHKKIDSDDKRFTSDILFRWREIHEKFIFTELGTNGDLIEKEQQEATLNQFKDYPFIIKRIVIDKPLGWEYRLTAELMRFLNKPYFRKLKDLQNNLYIKQRRRIETDSLGWINSIIQDLAFLPRPMENLLKNLNISWGEPGQSGDIDEIHHTCLLIRDYIEQIVTFEEQLHFTVVTKRHENIRLMMKNLIGSQILKIENIPVKLDNVVTVLNNMDLENDEPIEIKDTITFEIPEGWSKEFECEIRKLEDVDMSNY